MRSRRKKQTARLSTTQTHQNRGPSSNRILYFILAFLGISLLIYLITRFFRQSGSLPSDTAELTRIPYELEECRVNLHIPNMLEACGRKLCEQVAYYFPKPLNRLPDAVITIFNGTYVNAVPNINDLTPPLSELYLKKYMDILESDRWCLERAQITAAKAMTSIAVSNLGSTLSDYLFTLMSIAGPIGMRDCSGMNSFAALWLEIQPGRYNTSISIEVSDRINHNDFNHITLMVKQQPNDQLLFLCDAWGPSKTGRSTFCTREQIEIAKGNQGCAVYHPRLWNETHNIALHKINAEVFRKSSPDYLTFFNQIRQNEINKAFARVETLRRQPTPQRLTCE